MQKLEITYRGCVAIKAKYMQAHSMECTSVKLIELHLE